MYQPKTISAHTILLVNRIDPIERFDCNDYDYDYMSPECALDDCKMFAYEFYEEQLKGKGRFGFYVAKGLLEIDKPTLENNGYYVCAIPSELAQRAYKYALGGCDWDTTLDKPDLPSALRRIEHTKFVLEKNEPKSIKELAKKYDCLIELFPDETATILTERGRNFIHMYDRTTRARILTSGMRNYLKQVSDFIETNHPEHREALENINVNYTIGLMNGTYDNKGTFERSPDTDW